MAIIEIVRLNTRRLIKDKKRLEGIVKARTAEVVRQKDEILLQNTTLEQQKEEIQQQAEELQQTNHAIGLAYNEIHKKNEDITASIAYAKRIQRSILPSDEHLKENLGKDNFFVFYQPKDMVSGDFYWVEQLETNLQKQTFIAVADCTGHGVPGAFMSMIGNQLLYEIILIKQIYSPDLILKQLHKDIHRVLHQKETNTNDGMDMIMLTITENKQFLKTIIAYAGAMNPLYYVQNHELIEIKATKRAIGGRQTEEERIFEKHEIQIENEQNLTFYLCTDGFQDQFGGKDKRKFMVKKLRETLLQISVQKMEKQQLFLQKTMQNWIEEGKEKQIDDMTILGIRI